MSTADYEIFSAGDVALHCGAILADARLAYKTHGVLNAARDNAVVFPTRVGGTHADNDYLIGPGRALDPERSFIIVPNLLGNGLSSSPSNTPPPHDRMRFPAISHIDNVTLQQRLLAEIFGIERVALALGYSMGGQQAYHWAAIFPERVERVCAICCTARTPPHTYVFLEGVRAAITTDSAWRDGDYDSPPRKGLRALGRVWAGWGFSQAFYRQELYREYGFDDVESFLEGFWEARYRNADANNMLAMTATWQRSDIGAIPQFGGDLARALGALRARTLVMPSRTDLYFPPEDNEIEARLIADVEYRPIPSVYGHLAGGGYNPDDTDFIDRALMELLDR